MVLSRGVLRSRRLVGRRHYRPSIRTFKAASGPIDHRTAFDFRGIAVAGARDIVGLGHLNARIVLSRAEREEAWRLVRAILKMRRADRSLLAAGEFPDSARLAKMLEALQFAGWIGLYRGEEDWYYRVRSDQERIVNSLVIGA